MTSPNLALIIHQLSTLSLITSLFPLENELQVDPSTTESLPLLEAITSPSSPPPSSSPIPAELSLLLNLSLDDSPPLSLVLRISLPLTQASTSSSSSPIFTLPQPTWLSRSSHSQLLTELQDYCASHPSTASEEGEDQALELVLDVVDWIKERGLAVKLKEEEEEALKATRGKLEIEAVVGEIVRSWFWFPSLSTKSKRDDMVQWSSKYGLTGFVLAGKPAILCVEGQGNAIDSYMSEIKSVSWSDVPSFQKKVSERSRVPISQRTFSGMVEITSEIEKGGQRGNRGNMGQVRLWLEERGLGAEFGKVVGL